MFQLLAKYKDAARSISDFVMIGPRPHSGRSGSRSLDHREREDYIFTLPLTH
jgi:hypothetical protein